MPLGIKAKYLFVVLSKLYPYEKSNQNSQKHEKILIFLNCMVTFTQKVRLIWRSDFKTANWSAFKIYWHDLAYLSFEQIFADYNLLLSFYIFLYSLLFLSIITLIIFTINTLLKKSNNILIKKSLQIFLELLTSILYIPFLITSSLIIKYSLLPSNSINECFGHLSSNEISLNFPGAIISIFGFLTLLLLAYFKEGFSYNIEHAHAHKSMKSKANPKIDIHNKTLTSIIVILYMFLSDQHYYFYLGIFIVLEAFLGFSYLYSLPYYSRIVNFLYVCQELGPCAVAVFFAFCLFLDNGTVLIIMTLFLLPALGVGVYEMIMRRDEQFVINEENYVSVETFELMCRNKLLKAKPSKKVVKLIQDYYEKFGTKIVLVYLANHLNLKHEKNKIALLEISKGSYKGSDFFENFQIYKCQKHLVNLNENFSEGLKLKIFIKALGKIKTLELELFDKIIFLLDSFQSKTSLIKSTKITICRIHKTLNKLKKKYTKMLDKYPQSEILNEMLGSLHVMLGKYESGNKHIEKSILLHKENKKKNELSTLLSDKNAHIMFISANKKDFGKVLYLSHSMSIFLSVIQADSTNYYLKDFIPKVFHDTHYKRMEMSLKNFNDDKLFTNLTLFLCDTYGFLVECSLNIDCVGYDSSVNFVVGASPIRNMGRETVLITTDGDILNHSQRLPYFLGERCVSIKGKNIFEYFPLINCEKLLAGIPIFTYFYREDIKKTVKFGLYMQVKEKGTKHFYLLYIIHDESLILSLQSEIVKGTKLKKFTCILKLEVTEETEELFPDRSDCPGKAPSSLETNNNEYNILGNILEIATKKQVDKLLKLLKITKILTIFSFLAVIISNTIIFAVLNDEVKHSIDFKAINTISKTNMNLVYISFIARYIYISNYFNETSVFTYQDLESYLSNLPSIHDTIISNAEEWTYWTSYDVIFKETLPIYQNSSNTRITKTNLLDLISSTYKYGQLFLKDQSKNNLFYIGVNTFRLSMNNIQKSLNSLFSSEKQRLQVLRLKLDWLFYVGICIILTFSSFLMIMMYPLHKDLNAVWKKLYFEARKNSLNIRYALNSRVSKYHDMDDNLYPQESDIHAHNLTFPHIKHYIFRLSFIIILGFVIYFISTFVFCAKIQQHLAYKIDFAESMLNRRVYLFQRAFFLNEIYADYKDIGFGSLYGFSPLPPSKIGYNYISKKTSNSRKDVFQSHLQDVMQSDVWESTFETVKGNYGFMKFGFNSGLFDIRQESMFLIENYENCEFKCFLKVNNNFRDLMIFFNDTSNYADKSSRIYLESASQEFLYYVNISIGFMLAVILCYTLPYFSKEQKIIKYMKITECDRNTSIFSEERNQAKQVSFEVPSKFPESTKSGTRLA